MEINWDNVEFKNDKRFMSNMYPCVINIDGLTYNSSENYYMSMKFSGIDEDKATKLQMCSPRESKVLAKKWKDDIRDDWDTIKISVMRTALLAKFSQHPILAEKLLGTGDSHIEERNDWKDTFWGTYLGFGTNHLGKLLMKVRTLLQNA